jgi:effector-binding domain-containing protein
VFRGSVEGLPGKEKVMKILFYIIPCLVLLSCGPAESELADKKKKDPNYTIEPNPLAIKDQKDLTDAKGFVGIFFVPEMLTVTKVDSAPLSKAAETMAKNFELVAKDIELMGSKRFGSVGMISYNNDTTNFIFECVVPIEKMPSVKPKHSQVVVLEEGKMLIYNYYGPYQNLFSAYDEIRQYCAKYNLEQNGPLREFYITDATAVPDPKDWLTRIMLPVK